MAEIDWEAIKPGSIIVWRPLAGKQMRRMLVEERPEYRPGYRIAYVAGVEVGRHYQVRSRRGVRKPGDKRTFVISPTELVEVVPPCERATDTWLFMIKLRRTGLEWTYSGGEAARQTLLDELAAVEANVLELRAQIRERVA